MKPLALLVLLTACNPHLEPVAGCRPFSEECSATGLPRVCSDDQRWHAMGDLGACVAGEVCVVTEGRAHCTIAPLAASDGGTFAP